MINLTKGLSKAYAKDGILVNASPRCKGSAYPMLNSVR